MRFQNMLVAASAASVAMASPCKHSSSSAAASPSTSAVADATSSSVAVVQTSSSASSYETQVPEDTTALTSLTRAATTAEATYSATAASSSEAATLATSSTSAAAAASSASSASSDDTEVSSSSRASKAVSSGSGPYKAITGEIVQGKSTFYGGNLNGGACSFGGYALPAGMFGTAYSGAVWNNAAQCGTCLNVTGPNGNTITAMIVDECPECDKGHLDLFQNAFAKLGTISAGIIKTSYEFVTCGITTPIKLHNKSGTSQWWFSMQVINANEPVVSLEVSTDNGKTWKKTQRSNYNYFENSSGFGTQTVTVRVTSQSGKTVIVKNVGVASDTSVTAASNF